MREVYDTLKCHHPIQVNAYNMGDSPQPEKHENTITVVGWIGNSTIRLSFLSVKDNTIYRISYDYFQNDIVSYDINLIENDNEGLFTKLIDDYNKMEKL